MNNPEESPPEGSATADGLKADGAPPGAPRDAAPDGPAGPDGPDRPSVPARPVPPPGGVYPATIEVPEPIVPPPSPYDWVHDTSKGVAVVSGLGAGYFFFVQPESWAFAALIPLFLVAAVVAKVTGWGAEAGDGTMRGALSEKLEDLWENQAGSFYGLVSGSTFLVLEARAFVEGLAATSSLAGFFRGEALQFLLRFLGDTIGNIISAALWPWLWFQQWGVPALVVMVLGFILWDPFHDWVDRARGVEPGLLPPESDTRLD